MSEIQRIESKLNKIIDNDLAHIGQNIMDLTINQVEMKTKQDWLIKHYWLIVSASIGSLVAAVLGIILK